MFFKTSKAIEELKSEQLKLIDKEKAHASSFEKLAELKKLYRNGEGSIIAAL